MTATSTKEAAPNFLGMKLQVRSVSGSSEKNRSCASQSLTVNDDHIPTRPHFTHASAITVRTLWSAIYPSAVPMSAFYPWPHFGATSIPDDMLRLALYGRMAASFGNIIRPNKMQHYMDDLRNYADTIMPLQ